MLTVREVASLLGLSESAVRKIGPMDLPAYRLGPRRGAVRYREQDVAAYVQMCRHSVVPSEDEPLRFVSLTRTVRR